MTDFLSLINQPVVLWSLFVASITLVLLDYLLPVDWLAYIGYVCFSIFVGATLAVGPTLSLIAMIVVLLGVLVAHKFVFARFLTNAPRHERRPTMPDDQTIAPIEPTTR